MGRHITVKYVSEADVNEFMESEEYKALILKKSKREEKKLLKLNELQEKAELEEDQREKGVERYIQNVYGGITEELLGQVAYSYSKRAKNTNSYEEKKLFYSKKSSIISLFKPIEIHFNKRKISYINYPDYYIEEI